MGSSASTSASSGVVVSAIIASKVSQGQVNAHRKLNLYPSFMTSEKIKKIYFCLESSQTLKGAFYHAYLIVKSENYFWRCEIGGSSDDVQLIIVKCDQNKHTFEAEFVDKSKTIKDLMSFSIQKWLYTTYDIVTHNCFDFCKDIINNFTRSNQNIHKIDFYEKGNMGLGAAAVVTAVCGFFEGAPLGAPLGLPGMFIAGIVGGLVGFAVQRTTKAVVFD